MIAFEEILIKEEKCSTELEDEEEFKIASPLGATSECSNVNEKEICYDGVVLEIKTSNGIGPTAELLPKMEYGDKKFSSEHCAEFSDMDNIDSYSSLDCVKCEYTSGGGNHSNFIEKNFECEECHIKFRQNGTLRSHINAVHKKIRNFSCAFCEYRCYKKGQLDHHTNSVHKKIKPIECIQCDYKCSQKSSLVSHINSIHNHFKLFDCSHCDYKSSTRSTLVRHIDSIHMKIRPFQCRDCDYKCSRKPYLKQHWNTVHNKIKAHECHLCKNKYSLRSSLARHYNSAHKNELGW